MTGTEGSTVLSYTYTCEKMLGNLAPMSSVATRASGKQVGTWEGRISQTTARSREKWWYRQLAN